jgi:hypothetical protein
MKLSARDLPFILLSFIVPFVLFVLTSSHSLMFDDAGEFALVIKLGSIAHPPGTPSYILAGRIWLFITEIFHMNVIDSLNMFSSLAISFSSVLLFLSFRVITKFLCNKISTLHLFICSLIAISFGTAATSWAWANTVEVYSFQVLTIAIAFTGFVYYNFYRKPLWIFIAALGLGSGLGNHHLTMILFLPFTPLFFLDDFFIPRKQEDKKKKTKSREASLLIKYFRVLKTKPFLSLTGLTAVITLFFYGWMFYRAQGVYPFMFGKPDTLSELYYHMSGGVYAKNITGTSGSIMSSRIPFFLKLTFLQLFTFFPLFIAGIVFMFRRKLSAMLWTILLFFFFLFVYQVNNNQWSSTDAYMLLPFFILTIAVFYGAVIYADKIKAQYLLPLLLILQVFYNYPSHNRKTYPVSESLMDLLDKSAPKNSVIIISDWTTVIQYYYYRIVENFRPDLVVLNYDIKFTHYLILPTLYPDYYKKIKPEYDNFIRELTIAHPHQAVNTGCDLSTVPLSNAFKVLLSKMETIAKENKTEFLTDPHAHYFFSTEKYYNEARYVSGCFSASMPGDSAANDNFLALNFPFLKSDLIYEDPAALDKLVDFQAMLDRHLDFYKANNDTIRFAKAEIAKDKVLRMQREMKRSMSFAYKLK